ncbi:MAG TPA: MgtC/SapB family protein [Rhizomicrobium sp.]|jgi:putative Mg2+ transporter-C (MgtC) family protein
MGWEEILLRLGVAAAIGSVIGINREIHHKSAGFRTIAIVCVGTALAVLVAASGGDTAAPSRVMQGVVTGIGFLGGGVIVHHAQLETVEGLTTAASIWAAAGLGAACGMGYWGPALIGGLLIVALLAVGGRIESAVRNRFG